MRQAASHRGFLPSTKCSSSLTIRNTDFPKITIKLVIEWQNQKLRQNAVFLCILSFYLTVSCNFKDLIS